MSHLKLPRPLARLLVLEQRWVVTVLLAVVSLLFILSAIWIRSPALLGAGAVIFCIAVNRWSNQSLPADAGVASQPATPGDDQKAAPAAPRVDLVLEPVAPGDPQSLIDQMLVNDRYALLLRPQLISNLNARQLQLTGESFSEGMSLIPAGQVRLAQNDCGEGSQGVGQIIEVEPAFLDRFTVTNRQYQKFLEAGGYGDMSLWDEEALPALIDFVDQSGLPGPAFWYDGGYPRDEDDLPVVGVSWYEAQAYARWVGKRLPSDAEWVKAASWPVNEPGKPPLQRVYPWGDELDSRRANVWSSDEHKPVAVTGYAEGVSVGGVYHLVGNVWEWTAADFGAWHPPNQRFASSATLRSVRGGAYDTYFPNHCTNHFQSGERPTNRQRNTGFRCAVSACDLAPLPELPACPASDEIASTEGVLA